MRLQDLDDFVTPQRVRNYGLMLAAGNVLGLIGWLAAMHADVDPFGKPFGYDFITFYAQSILALKGQAALAYVPYKMLTIEQTMIPADRMLFLWHYPPPFALITLPLALVPYKLAYAGFVAATFALYLAVIRRISDHPWALLLAAVFPAVFLNTFHGQNGFLNAAVMGFGLICLERRPFVAGLVLGLLVYKPHFGVLLPFLFLVSRNWRAFAGAALSAMLFLALSVAAFGTAPWLAFVDNLSFVRQLLESGWLPWPKMPSWFVTFSYLGVPKPVAYALHATIALALCVTTLRAWRGPGATELKLALAVLATLSVSPYVFDYDLTLLALPIALVAEYGRRYPLPPGTKIALVLAFVTPIAFLSIASLTHLQLMPLALLGFFISTWRCLQAEQRRAASDPAQLPDPRRDGKRRYFFASV